MFAAVIKQSQLDDKDRTIRIQQNMITKLEAEVDETNAGKNRQTTDQTDTANTATQTDRVSANSISIQSTPYQSSNFSLVLLFELGATSIGELWWIE